MCLCVVFMCIQVSVQAQEVSVQINTETRAECLISFSPIPLLKTIFIGAEEMAQGLSTLDALPEDLDSGIHTAAHKCP